MGSQIGLHISVVEPYEVARLISSEFAVVILIFAIAFAVFNRNAPAQPKPCKESVGGMGVPMSDTTPCKLIP